MGLEGIVSKRLGSLPLRPLARLAQDEEPGGAGDAAGGGRGLGQGALAVKPDAAETFWQRFLATYRFRRRFGRENWWASFRGAIRAA
jgi:hypothetical protein